MESRLLTAVQIGLGAVAMATLVLYGVLAAASDLAFWIFAILFLLFLGVDLALHVRALRRRGAGGPKNGA